LPSLVSVGWIVATGWLSFLEAGGQEIGWDRMEEGADVILQFSRPYLTDEAWSELARTGSSSRDSGPAGNYQWRKPTAKSSTSRRRSR
jgi:hypothetical protein